MNTMKLGGITFKVVPSGTEIRKGVIVSDDDVIFRGNRAWCSRKVWRALQKDPHVLKISEEFNQYEITDSPEVYDIAVYEADRAYGGPEDGGWYYRVGTSIRTLCKAYSWTEAKEKSDRANRLFDHMAKKKFNIEHPLYNGGVYFVVPWLTFSNGKVTDSIKSTYPDQPPKYIPEGQ